MPLPMPHYNSFAAHAPAVLSYQTGPHQAGSGLKNKLISSTFIAYHFDKDLIRIFILIPLQCRAQGQQIFFHELKQLPETHIRANYTRLLQKMGRKTEVCLALQ